ncbi:hypothetical protein ACN7OV_09685 [Aerococcus urinaeequi]|uniref:Lipoprotein n=2 Tax=Lactobacillales TaxID=186826 RepID=A0AA47IZV6_9LACT|nr:hypothetical protein [Aerococcus urinaeequi]HJA90051.1 hypothetical protein [Candidatus Jeotgalibaca merdavium]MCY7730491.1 hypothetical protein [Aerococcus urinaeequi]MDT2762047.1 hypothetical protein [Aerococcus urinaeequi]WAT24189.1 hypothetical protein OZ415_07995 [Aerococcus urinaeequi]HJH01669.1 hypothetical protein [Aerococcus urinaeequi]
MKKLILSLLMVSFLSGCNAKNSQADDNDLTSDGVSMENESSETTILYSGTVIDSGVTNEKGLFVSNLKPEDETKAASFDEVILLTEDVNLIDQETGDAIVLSDIKEGDTVSVTLIEHAPTTMSIPPQIPGMGIVKIERVSEK